MNASIIFLGAAIVALAVLFVVQARRLRGAEKRLSFLEEAVESHTDLIVSNTSLAKAALEAASRKPKQKKEAKPC